jgi:hypothetical protein
MVVLFYVPFMAHEDAGAVQVNVAVGESPESDVTPMLQCGSPMYLACWGPYVAT